MAYESVNGQWPAGTRDGRDLKPTPQEAIAGFRRLFRKAFGRPYRGRIILTSGRRRTWYGSRSRTMRVNPDESGGGWHEIVHSVSHMASGRLYGENHGPRHAFIERELIRMVVEGGWLEGRLRREPKPAPEVDNTLTRRNATIASIKRWTTKATGSGMVPDKSREETPKEGRREPDVRPIRATPVLWR